MTDDDGTPTLPDPTAPLTDHLPERLAAVLREPGPQLVRRELVLEAVRQRNAMRDIARELDGELEAARVMLCAEASGIHDAGRSSYIADSIKILRSRVRGALR